MDTKHGASARLTSIFLGIMLLLTLVGIVMRSICMAFFYDVNLGYYISGEPLPVIMNIFFFSTFAASVAFAFIIAKKSAMMGVTEKSIAMRATNAFCALGFFFLSVMTLMGYTEWYSSNPTTLFAAANLLAALYFALGVGKQETPYRALFSIAVVASLAYVLATSYFDEYVPMNAPTKILLHVSCLCAMFFFLYESKAQLDNKKKTLYPLSLCSALFFSGVYSLPGIINYLSGYTVRNYFIRLNYFVFDILFAIIFVYCLVRTITIITASAKKEVVSTEEITLPEEGTEEVLEEIPEESHEASVPSEETAEGNPEL